MGIFIKVWWMYILEWVCTRQNKLESCSNHTWLLILRFPHIILIFSLFCSGLLPWLKWSDIHIESTHMCSGSLLWLCWILFCWYRHLRCLQAQIHLLCHQNPRCAQKLPSGSHCSSVYLCLILAFITQHSMLTVLPRGFTQMLPLGHYSLETTYHESCHSWDYVFMSSIYTAWRSQTLSLLTAYLCKKEYNRIAEISATTSSQYHSSYSSYSNTNFRGSKALPQRTLHLLQYRRQKLS